MFSVFEINILETTHSNLVIEFVGYKHGYLILGIVLLVNYWSPEFKLYIVSK